MASPNTWLASGNRPIKWQPESRVLLASHLPRKWDEHGVAWVERAGEYDTTFESLRPPTRRLEGLRLRRGPQRTDKTFYTR